MQILKIYSEAIMFPSGCNRLKNLSNPANSKFPNCCVESLICLGKVSQNYSEQTPQGRDLPELN